MHHYEGVFILNPDLASDTAKGVVGQIQELITKNGGRVDGLQEWGKRRLAYRIKKKQEGHYIILNFQVESDKTIKIEQTIRLNDNVLRYLLVRKNGQ